MRKINDIDAIKRSDSLQTGTSGIGLHSLQTLQQPNYETNHTITDTPNSPRAAGAIKGVDIEEDGFAAYA